MNKRRLDTDNNNVPEQQRGRQFWCHNALSDTYERYFLDPTLFLSTMCRDALQLIEHMATIDHCLAYHAGRFTGSFSIKTEHDVQYMIEGNGLAFDKNTILIGISEDFKTALVWKKRTWELFSMTIPEKASSERPNMAWSLPAVFSGQYKLYSNGLLLSVKSDDFNVLKNRVLLYEDETNKMTELSQLNTIRTTLFLAQDSRLFFFNSETSVLGVYDPNSRTVTRSAPVYHCLGVDNKPLLRGPKSCHYSVFNCISVDRMSKFVALSCCFDLCEGKFVINVYTSDLQHLIFSTAVNIDMSPLRRSPLERIPCYIDSLGVLAYVIQEIPDYIPEPELLPGARFTQTLVVLDIFTGEKTTHELSCDATTAHRYIKSFCVTSNGDVIMYAMPRAAVRGL